MARLKNPSMENLFLEICEKIANSKQGIEHILKDDKRYPSIWTFFKWKRENESLNKIYLEAKETQGHLFADQINDIAQELEDLGSQSEPDFISAHTRRLVALQNSRAWQAKYFAPRHFGDTNTQKVEEMYEVLQKEMGKDLNDDAE